MPRLQVSEDGAVKTVYERGNTLYSDAAPTGPLVHQQDDRAAVALAAKL